MKILYIAGPYRADTINGVFNNIMEARKRMEWAWRNNWIPVCPHMNSAFSDGVVSDEVILEGYLQLVEKCDAILLMHGWQKSLGSMGEYIRACDCELELILDPLVRRVWDEESPISDKIWGAL